jgi:hypothetical protein
VDESNQRAACSSELEESLAKDARLETTHLQLLSAAQHGHVRPAGIVLTFVIKVGHSRAFLGPSPDET